MFANGSGLSALEVKRAKLSPDLPSENGRSKTRGNLQVFTAQKSADLTDQKIRRILLKVTSIFLQQNLHQKSAAKSERQLLKVTSSKTCTKIRKKITEEKTAETSTPAIEILEENKKEPAG